MTVADQSFPARSGLPETISKGANAFGRLPFPVVLYLVAVALPISFNAGPLALTTLRLLLLLVSIPLTIQLLTGKFGKLFITDYCFFLHIAWAAVALARNNPEMVVQQVGSVGMEFVGGYLVGRAYIRDRATFLTLSKWLVFMVCLFIPFALHETMTGRAIILENIRKLPGITSPAIVNIEQRLGLERVQASFAHPIHFGLFCSVAFSLSFVALKGMTSEAWRYLASLSIAATGFLALSSGAITAIAIQFALIIWAAVFAKVEKRWWILVGLFALFYVTVDILSNRSPIKVFMSYATFSAHNAYWRAIIFDWGIDNIFGSVERNIPGSPIFGIGMNDWVRPHFMNSGSMDNFWLVMGVRYGVPGVGILAIGYGYAIYRVMKRNLVGDERLTLIRRAWVFTFLGLTFTLCTVHVWTNIYSFVFFMFGSGMWLILAEPEDGNNSATDDAAAPQGRAGPVYSRSRIEDAPRHPAKPASQHATTGTPLRTSRENQSFSRYNRSKP